MAFYRNAGELIFGTRLKRISERFLMDVSRIYRHLKIPFETGWFPIFYLLQERENLSVTEIARELEVTHSAISQAVTVLEKKKLITFSIDKSDKRKRYINFTKKGQDLLQQVIPVWEAMKRAVPGMFDEGPHSRLILKSLDEIEESMEKIGVYERILNDLRISGNGILSIVPYAPLYREHYKNLILHWILENQNSEVCDADYINHPEIAVKEGRAVILLARMKEDIIGVIAAEKMKSDIMRIIYFVVHEKWRNRNVGRELLKELIRNAKETPAGKLSIAIERSLPQAVGLFRSMGFILHSVESDERQEDIQGTLLHMELSLK